MDIVKEDEIKERLMDFYLNGGGKTYFVGYKSLAKHYSIVVKLSCFWTYSKTVRDITDISTLYICLMLVLLRRLWVN